MALKSTIPRVILTVDASGGRAAISIADGDALRSSCVMPSGAGIADNLAVMLEECLGRAKATAKSLDAVAVMIGPGSFTGIRASLALALGFSAAAGTPVHGMRLGDVFCACLPDLTRPLWVAVTARRGRVFLERDGIAAGFAEDHVPDPDGPIALAGERAIDIAATLAARGHDILLTDARYPEPLAIAAALRSQIEHGRPTARPMPLYVDPPEAKLPQAGLRPEPV